VPEQLKVGSDRAYFDTEISKMLEIADERIRAAICCYLVLVSV